MKRYANISKASGVESYDYSPTYSYLTVKFKDKTVLTYTANSNTVDQIRSMSTLADLGIGLHRYLTKNKPIYYKGRPTNSAVDLLNDEDYSVNKISYPKYTFENIRWNNGKDWIEISFKDGHTQTYTIESTGKRDVINMIKYAIKGSGLKQYIDDEKPTSVEDLTNENLIHK